MSASTVGCLSAPQALTRSAGRCLDAVVAGKVQDVVRRAVVEPLVGVGQLFVDDEPFGQHQQHEPTLGGFEVAGVGGAVQATGGQLVLRGGVVEVAVQSMIVPTVSDIM